MDKLLSGTPTEVPEVYAARSPVNHADKIVTPLLVRVFIYS
jgi:dipeptidyl aminopeptidase/acylaminoacyl peptidase